MQELERVDGARFNYAIGERLYLTAIAVQTERNSTLLLNLHRIVNVNRLAIEKHLACVCLRQWLCVIKAYILNELLTQLRTENVPVSVDDGSGGLGFRHLEYLYSKVSTKYLAAVCVDLLMIRQTIDLLQRNLLPAQAASDFVLSPKITAGSGGSFFNINTQV